jgi:Transcriptional regulator/sugar kinase
MIAIGIDIGGMSIKGAAVDSNGRVYEKFSMPFVKGEPGEVTIRKLAEIVKEYIAANGLEGKIAGIGIGSPGSLDVKNGIVNYANNLGWNELPVAKLMQEVLPYPVRLTNDANAACLGEAKYGAGKSYETIIMLTLGTGVGGGIIINGKLFEGNEGKGGELGHTVIVVDGEPCTCGRKGCLEAYASASALIRETKKAMRLNKRSLMWKISPDIELVNGKLPFEAAKQGDAAAIKVLDDYVKYLGEGILNYCNIFRPNVIVLSGGVANAGEFLFSRLNNYIKERNYGYKSTPEVKVVPAELGYDSGKIGAAALFFE